MRNRGIAGSITVLWLFCTATLTHADQELCPHFLVRGPERIFFSNTETVLLCGDPDSEAWRNVPASQAEFHLKAMLQDRGYYGANVVREGEHLIAVLGKPTYTREVRLENPVPGIEISEFRRLKGQRLTPSFLREVEDRFTFALKELGYACAKATTKADAQTGDFVVMLEPGQKSPLTRVNVEETEYLHRNVLERFHAFEVGETLHGEAVPLTVQRTVTNGIIQNTYFEAICEQNGTVLNQSVSPGAPRIVTLGFGINTEKGFIAKASWRHTRLGHLGSNVDFSLRTSFRDSQRNRQDFTATADWYYLSEPSRHFLKPLATVGRESHANYEIFQTRFEFLPTWKWNRGTTGFIFNVGPSITGVKTVRGVGRPSSYYSALRLEFDVMSHEYELYRTSPRGGFHFNLHATSSSRNLLSDVSAHTIALRAKHLWNLGDFKPALFVLGVRAAAITTLTDDADVTSLPATLKNYLGGESDLRGFSLQELPGPEGAGTSFSLGVELRLSKLLPWGIEPLTFFDIGKVGTRSFELDSPLFLSPGIGVRLESVFGVLRMTASHGFLSKTTPKFPRSLSHWQFYLSYGEEF